MGEILTKNLNMLKSIAKEGQSPVENKKKTKVLHITDYQPHPSPFKDLIHCSTSLTNSYIISISDHGCVAFWAPAEKSPEITFSFKVPFRIYHKWGFYTI